MLDNQPARPGTSLIGTVNGVPGVRYGHTEPQAPVNRAARARELTAKLDRRHATGADKHALTAAAKERLANAVRDKGYGTRRFIIDMTKADGWMEILPELQDTGMVTIGRSLNWDAPVWVLTDAGMHVRTNLLDNRVMRHLAEQVRTELDGETLADMAAYLDEDAVCQGHYDDDRTLLSGVFAGEPTFCDGTCVQDYVGPGTELLRLFTHVARWSGESGADLRQEIEQRLGWTG